VPRGLARDVGLVAATLYEVRGGGRAFLASSSSVSISLRAISSTRSFIGSFDC